MHSPRVALRIRALRAEVSHRRTAPARRDGRDLRGIARSPQWAAPGRPRQPVRPRRLAGIAQRLCRDTAVATAGGLAVRPFVALGNRLCPQGRADNGPGPCPPCCWAWPPACCGPRAPGPILGLVLTGAASPARAPTPPCCCSPMRPAPPLPWRSRCSPAAAYSPPSSAVSGPANGCGAAWESRCCSRSPPSPWGGTAACSRASPLQEPTGWSSRSSRY